MPIVFALFSRKFCDKTLDLSLEVSENCKKMNKILAISGWQTMVLLG